MATEKKEQAFDINAFMMDAVVGAPCITLLGEGGTGKTTLSCTFPKPFLLRVEDGAATVAGMDDVKVSPVLTKTASIELFLNGLIEQEHDRRTLILDSVTKLEQYAVKEVLESDPKAKSINSAMGGYGAGYRAVSEKHRRIKALCDRLQREKNMAIVFIAHADVATVNLPDCEAFDQYTLRINKNCLSHYVDDVDMVAHLKLKTITVEVGEAVKAKSSGKIVAVCHKEASSVSKNRYGITKEIPVDKGVNAFVEYIPFFK